MRSPLFVDFNLFTFPSRIPVNKACGRPFHNLKTEIGSGHELEDHVEHPLTETNSRIIYCCHWCQVSSGDDNDTHKYKYTDKDTYTYKVDISIISRLLNCFTLNRSQGALLCVDVWACGRSWPLSSGRRGWGRGRKWTWPHPPPARIKAGHRPGKNQGSLRDRSGDKERVRTDVMNSQAPWQQTLERCDGERSVEQPRKDPSLLSRAPGKFQSVGGALCFRQSGWRCIVSCDQHALWQKMRFSWPAASKVKRK